MIEIALPKSGENVILGTVSRFKAHLKLRFKVHPSVEELFATWGGNEKTLVAKYGRQWEGKDEEATKSLVCWNLGQNPGVASIDPSGGFFCLDKIGGALLEPRQFTGPLGPVTAEVLNMSWLRLCGISESAGIEIAIRGVFTPQKVDEIAEKIKLASRTIYITYLKPIDVTVGVFTQPWNEVR
jgi:hypothetical protein